MSKYPSKIQAKIDKAKAKIKNEVVQDRPGINKAKGGGWRFIHDGSMVIVPPFEAGFFTETTTKHTVFIGNSEGQCRGEIARLGLVE